MPTEPHITLTEDARAVALRKIRDLQQAVGTIASIIKEGAIDANLATNCVKVSEFYLTDLCKALGIETEGAVERQQRNVDLRAANTRIARLEEQLGGEQSPDMTQAAVKNLYDRLNKWWNLDGFGHISDGVAFGPYGATVNFSCLLFGDFRLIDSDTPVSDKSRKEQWHESLRERGFILTEEDRDVSILDCDHNRKVLVELFQARLPSARILRFENTHKRQSTEFTLRGVQVFITNIAEILALPVPKRKTP
jgi:hypothetical protein